MSELKNRTIVGAIGISLVIVFIALAPLDWFHPIFGIGLLLIALCGLWEFYSVARVKGFQPAIWVGMGGAALYLVARFFYIDWFPSLSVLPVAGLMVAAFALFIFFLFRGAGALGNLAVSLLGLIYVAVPLGYVLDVVSDFGVLWLVFILVVTVTTDMAAYFTGRFIGRVRLWPSVSPGKTIEGTLGGAFIGILVGCALAWSCLGSLPTAEIWILIISLPLLGQLADLFESRIKRDAKVKDSGFLPGLGGVLDVVDSLLFNVPFTYVVHRLFLEGMR